MEGFETTVDLPIAEAELAVRRALLDEGFGVLTEIDMAATLRAKLGVRRPALKILGACNPSLANRALAADPTSALVLPCNVVVEADGETRTRLAIADPRALFSTGGDSARGEMAALADEAAAALARALAHVGR